MDAEISIGLHLTPWPPLRRPCAAAAAAVMTRLGRGNPTVTHSSRPPPIDHDSDANGPLRVRVRPATLALVTGRHRVRAPPEATRTRWNLKGRTFEIRQVTCPGTTASARWRRDARAAGPGRVVRRKGLHVHGRPSAWHQGEWRDGRASCRRGKGAVPVPLSLLAAVRDGGGVASGTV
jgi:hypothetical protein